jgi:outer membrane protein assembly factor BamD
MNLFTHSLFTHKRPAKVGAIALSLALSLAMFPAEAATKTKVPKKKKNVDLSANPLAGVDSRQPDKELYDKAMIALKKGRFDVARLDLQTMLNTYPNSEFQMRAKLAVGDSWFKEGGSAALTQAEAEYKDFITFFPQAPEAAEAQMKVADIYFMQMEKPDRDFTNVQRAEAEYRTMINQFPDSSLVPRAKQKLREVQEVLGEREFLIGQFYNTRLNFAGSLARLETVADSYPLYSKSDMVWLTIGDDYAGEAKKVQEAVGMPGAIRERLEQVYFDKAAAAYAKVITRYPMAPRVEDARDRLVAMNRPVPEPTDAAVAENDAEEKSRQPVRFIDTTLGMVKHGPMVVEASHVGDPTMVTPKRTIAPDVRREDQQIFTAAVKAGQPGAPAPEAAAPTPTGTNEPPRSDRPQAPLQFETVPGAGSDQGGAGTTSAGSAIIAAPNSAPAAPADDPNSPVKSIKTTETVLPTAEAPAPAPDQVNDIKPGMVPAQNTVTDPKDKAAKKPKLDQSEDSSSKKKKKKGLSKLNPF